MSRIFCSLEILLLVLLLVSTDSIYSQSNIKIGVEGGVISSNLRGNDLPHYRVNQKDVYAGITLEYRIYNSFFLKSGISYETKGFSISTINVPYYEGKIGDLAIGGVEIGYVTIPLLVKYATSGKIQFFANAGPYISFMAKSTNLIVKKTDFGFTSGIGLQMPKEKNTFSIEIRNSLGLVDIGDSVLTNEAIKTNAFYLLLGYAYNI